MKKFLLITASLLLGLSAYASNKLPSPKSENLQPINKIVAVVNKDIITENDLQKAMAAAKKQFSHRGIPIPKQNVLRKKILDGLIYQKLQLELAKNNNITASDQQVEDAMKRIAEQNHISVDELKQKLKQENISLPVFKQQIKDQIVVNTLQQEVIRDKLKLDDSNVSAFKKKLATDNAVTEYKVTDYLIPLTGDATAADKQSAQKLAQNIAQKLKRNKTIKDKAVVVNNLGWKALTDLPDIFATHIVKMRTGTVSSPIRAGNGYHVLKLEATKDKTQDITDQQARQLLFQKQSQKILKQWLDQLRSQSYVKIYD